ncbi:MULTISPECIES: hypothetical protein [unclassified Enterococcus]|nr:MULTISPECIES: hypothetical protein [unclassified Enterococcus]
MLKLTGAANGGTENQNGLPSGCPVRTLGCSQENRNGTIKRRSGLNE